MATPTNIIEEPSESLKYKTWVLKVSIHCEGCKKKVKKVLASIQGIQNFDVDLRLQRVVVTGNVDADILIYKLIKSGRKAELWPEISNNNNNNQKHKMSTGSRDNNKEKISDVQTINASPSGGAAGDKEKQTPGKVVNPATAEPSGVGADKVGKAEVTTAGVSPAKVNQVENTKTAGIVTTKVNQPETLGVPTSKENTTPVKKNEDGGAGSKVDAAGGGGGGNKPEMGPVGSSEVEKKSGGGKKKKKKGQNGNMSGPSQEQSCSQEEDEEAISANAWRGPHRNNNSVTPPPPPANNNPPRHLQNQFPPDCDIDYAPIPRMPIPPHGPIPHGPIPHGLTLSHPPPAGPVYVTSYNMAHPTPNYTTSYYASPTPYSSSSSYNSYYQEQRETRVEPPPPSYYYNDSYTRVVHQQQPLDSFEMFSDENPNGCSVM
ncbi:heavy metal-associated isoprenylated plant protein 36-like [Impatiens glandulifera]|uniref:heavy metal-associated isoprenylated plant protein 36-like n=1 Tax=Impatiens glandulifera TaxID=253017 RepID=UPI001FB063DD|nr:heavy metal-associated isoprenylated plant protein 36-like [Impatiens glandulifera]